MHKGVADLLQQLAHTIYREYRLVRCEWSQLEPRTHILGTRFLFAEVGGEGGEQREREEKLQREGEAVNPGLEISELGNGESSVVEIHPN